MIVNEQIFRNGKLEFPNVDGFSYNIPGSTLAFDKSEKRPVHGAWDIDSDPRWVEELPNGNLRFHESLKYYPPVGSLLSSKGDREHDRRPFDDKILKTLREFLLRTNRWFIGFSNIIFNQEPIHFICA